MNSVLVDTNVWVDVVLKRPEFFDESYAVLLACIEDGIRMVVAGTSLKDVFYWAERSAGAQAAYDALGFVFQIADIATVDGSVCKAAVHLERPDYEDGIIVACAQAESVDAVITRDAKGFMDAKCAKRTPHEFLEAQGWEVCDLGARKSLVRD